MTIGTAADEFIDLLREHGIEHIINKGKTKPHTLTPFAQVSGTRILYPPEAVQE
ncbi:hypothetical protein [Massilia sp. 9I]|uniref:hypothetical protein n=1 Tax=Massilia sp. 9I TaxID=2653152 RepID=UPI00135B31BC|nr:hypothetical protein [Massilia sp. 9I]